MARKNKEFHFDFNEDADPVEELHRLRVAMAKHFKTIEAFMEYVNATPTPEEYLARRAAEAQKPKPKQKPRPKTAAARAKKPAKPRSAAKPKPRRAQKAAAGK